MSSSPMTKTITHTASGSSCTIHEFGATVISFKTSCGRECLFVSRDAKMDGSKAVRGGIPLVYPQFGQPDTSMPQHGFLRTNTWTIVPDSEFDTVDAAGIQYSLALNDVQASRGGKWDIRTTEYDCTCIYTIKIEAKKLTTSLAITNTSTKSFDFQALLHTYYMVDDHAAMDGSQCYVKGLQGYSVNDKITGENGSICGEEPVITDKNVDRIYSPPAGKDTVDVTIGVGGGGTTMKLVATATMDGSSFPVSCVVWNPYKEKAAEMSDFGDDQYVDMICVEPGILDNAILEGGKTAELSQVLELQ